MKAMKAMKSMKAAKKKNKGTSKETTSKKNKTPVLKRPAGNQQGQKASLRDQTDSWRDAAALAAKDDGGPEGEEEENVEQDPEVNPGDGQMVLHGASLPQIQKVEQDAGQRPSATGAEKYVS